jgi:hypothetical protein
MEQKYWTWRKYETAQLQLRFEFSSPLRNEKWSIRKLRKVQFVHMLNLLSSMPWSHSSAFLDLGTRWSMVGFTPLSFYPRIKSCRKPTGRRLSDTQSLSGRCGKEKNLTLMEVELRLSSPSLYRLSYPDSTLLLNKIKKDDGTEKSHVSLCCWFSGVFVTYVNRSLLIANQGCSKPLWIQLYWSTLAIKILSPFTLSQTKGPHVVLKLIKISRHFVEWKPKVTCRLKGYERGDDREWMQGVVSSNARP